jgi:hypothetical protein
MTKKGADALVQLRADNVFELARLRVRFGIVDGKSVLEQPFRQAMPPHYVAGPAATRFRQAHIAFVHFHKLEIGHASKRAHRVGSAWRANAVNLRAGSLFAAHPDAFEQMIETDFVIQRNSGIRLRGIQTQASMCER